MIKIIGDKIHKRTRAAQFSDLFRISVVSFEATVARSIFDIDRTMTSEKFWNLLRH